MLPICVEALLMQIADMSDSFNAFSKQSDTPQTQLSSILFYLNQHLKDPVTLDEISDHFFISKHHLNKVFKKATGTTVIDYLLRKRIAYAQMAATQKKPLQTAAFLTILLFIVLMCAYQDIRLAQTAESSPSQMILVLEM